MTNSGPRAIVAGHGDFAAGLVSAVEVITGRGSLFYAVAVPELSAADIETLLRETMERTGARVLFTDLHAGSCTMAARRILREAPFPFIVAEQMADAAEKVVAAARGTQQEAR